MNLLGDFRNIRRNFEIGFVILFQVVGFTNPGVTIKKLDNPIANLLVPRARGINHIAIQ